MAIKQRQDYQKQDTVKVSVQFKKTQSKCVNPKKLQYKRDKKKQDKRRKQGREEKTFQNEIYSEIKTFTHNRKNKNVMTQYDWEFKEYLIGFWDNQKHKSGRWITENDKQYMDRHEYNDYNRICYYLDMKEYYEEEKRFESQMRMDEEEQDRYNKQKIQINIKKTQSPLEKVNVYCPNCNSILDTK